MSTRVPLDMKLVLSLFAFAILLVGCSPRQSAVPPALRAIGLDRFPDLNRAPDISVKVDCCEMYYYNVSKDITVLVAELEEFAKSSGSISLNPVQGAPHFRRFNAPSDPEIRLWTEDNWYDPKKGAHPVVPGRSRIMISKSKQHNNSPSGLWNK